MTPADYLTLARGLLSLVLLILAATSIGDPGLGTGIYLTAWTTDVFDGWVARKTGKRGLLGRWDFPLDMLLVWSGAVYSARAGLASPIFVGIWSLVWILIALITKNTAAIMLTAFVGIVVSSVGLLRVSPFWFVVAMIWAGGMILFDLKRFLDVIKGFIHSASVFFGRSANP